MFKLKGIKNLLSCLLVLVMILSVMPTGMAAVHASSETITVIPKGDISSYASITQVNGLPNDEIISDCDYQGKTYVLAKNQDERYILYSSSDGITFSSVDLRDRFIPLINCEGEITDFEVYKMKVINNTLVFHGLVTCLTPVYSYGDKENLISSFSISSDDGVHFINMNTPVFRFLDYSNVMRINDNYKPVIVTCNEKYIYYAPNMEFTAYDPDTKTDSYENSYYISDNLNNWRKCNLPDFDTAQDYSFLRICVSQAAILLVHYSKWLGEGGSSQIPRAMYSTSNFTSYTKHNLSVLDYPARLDGLTQYPNSTYWENGEFDLIAVGDTQFLVFVYCWKWDWKSAPPTPIKYCYRASVFDVKTSQYSTMIDFIHDQFTNDYWNAIAFWGNERLYSSIISTSPDLNGCQALYSTDGFKTFEMKSIPDSQADFFHFDVLQNYVATEEFLIRLSKRANTLCVVSKNYSQVFDVTVSGIEQIFDSNGKLYCITDSGCFCVSCDALIQSLTNVPPHVHSYSSIVTKQPSCTENGERTYTCSGCSSTYTEAIPSLGHDYNSVVTKPTTCKEKGERTYTCSRCGDSYTETIEKLSHTGKVIRIEPTCTVSGALYTVCATCGEPLSNVTTLPAKGHTPQVITESATCMSDGKQFTKCSVCGTLLSEVVVLSKIDHVFGAWVTVKEPTTEEDGLKERECTLGCGTKETEVLPKIITKTVEDKDSGISLIYPEAAFDGTVELKIEQLFDGAAFQLVDLNSEQNAVFDIATVKNGVTVQPNGKVKVRIPVPAGFDPSKCVVYHVSSETGKLKKLSARYVNGFMEFETDHFSVYAIVIEKKLPPTIRIHNFVPLRTEDYCATIKYSVSNEDIQNPVEGARIQWFINDQKMTEGDFCIVEDAKQSYSIQVKYVKNGEVLAESEIEQVKIKTGFFAKLKAFFRALFGRLPVLTQEWIGIEIIERVLPD